jgi:hypothetical protein
VKVLLAHDNNKTAIYKLSMNSLTKYAQTNENKLIKNALIFPACATKFLATYKMFSIVPTDAVSITVIDEYIVKTNSVVIQVISYGQGTHDKD